MALPKAKKIVTVLAVLLVAGLAVIWGLHYKHQYHGPSHFPRTAWASAGSADPVAALETASWAAAHGDGKTMLASLTPALQKALQNAWEKSAKAQGMSEEDFLASHVSRFFSSVLGFRVLNEQVVKPDQVRLQIYVQGWWQKVTVTMKKIDKEWKVAGLRGG